MYLNAAYQNCNSETLGTLTSDENRIMLGLVLIAGPSCVEEHDTYWDITGAECVMFKSNTT